MAPLGNLLSALGASWHYWGVAVFCVAFWCEPDLLADQESLSALGPFILYEFFSMFFEIFGGMAAQRPTKIARISVTVGIGLAWMGFCYLFFAKGFHYAGLTWWAFACTQAWAFDIISNKGKVMGIAAMRGPCFLAAVWAGIVCQDELRLWGLTGVSPLALESIAASGIKVNLTIQGLLFTLLIYSTWVAAFTFSVYSNQADQKSQAAVGSGGSAPPIKTRDLAVVGLIFIPFLLCLALGILGVTVPLPLALLVPIGALSANGVGLWSRVKQGKR